MVISGGGPASFLLKENIKPGDVITAQFNVKSACNLDWTNIEQAAGGGPWLLKDGNVCIDFAEENWNSTFSTTKHPRSAAGVTSDGKLILVTVDGRQSISTGISLQDLALLMKRLGAVNAINLDGGGSTTLSVKGFLINSVSEGDERPVADALLVYAHQPICPGIPKLKISTASTEFASGQGVQLALTSGDDAKPLTQDQLDKVIWGTTGGIGLVNQQGYFTPIKAGKGMIGAMIDSQSTEIVVNVVAGNPSKLTAQLVADKVDPLRSILSITASDANNNKVTGKEVLLNITGGKSDLESGITDDKGNFSTGITWDAASTERSAVAIVGNISAEAK